MPQCLNCGEIAPRANSLCGSCLQQVASTALPGPDTVAASGETSSAGDASPAQGTPPGSRQGWRRRPVVAALAASAGAATLALALLGTRGAGGEAPPQADQTSLAGVVAPPVGPRIATGAPKWTTRANRAGHPRSIAFELPAENTASAWLTRVRPVLVVRCLARTTEAFVFTQLPAAIEPQDDRRTVRVGFDEEGPVTERWAGSADHDALFAPNAVAFARRLARARTMRFAFTPHNGPTANIEFQVDGFAEHVGSVARMCRWK